MSVAVPSGCLTDSPQMKQRYDRALSGMILRDRNHPSVAIWGLSNETPDGRCFATPPSRCRWFGLWTTRGW